MKKNSSAILLFFFLLCFCRASNAANIDLSGSWGIEISCKIVHRIVETFIYPNGSITTSSGFLPQDFNIPVNIVATQAPDGSVSIKVNDPAYPITVNGKISGNDITFAYSGRIQISSCPTDLNIEAVGIISSREILGTVSGSFHQEGSTTRQGQACRFTSDGTFSGAPFKIKIPSLVLPPEPSEAFHNGRPLDPQLATKDPVHIATGNMFIIAPGLAIPGKNLGISFERVYNSRENSPGVFGYGWTHSYNLQLSLNPETSDARIIDGEGKVYLFAYNSYTKAYIAQRGEHSTLTKTTAGFTWTRKDGKQYIFDLKGKLIQVKDRWGNTISLAYNASNQLIQITDTVGRKIYLTYDSAGKIIQLSDPANRRLIYAYDRDANLIQAIDQLGSRTFYEYDANHNLTRKIDGHGKSAYFTYDANDRCISTSYESNLNRTDLNYDPVNKKTTVTDSKGNTTANYYNDDLMLARMVNAQGAQTSSAWDNDLNRVSFTDELGRTAQMRYDAKGNMTKLIDAQGNATAYTYEPNFSLIRSITDAQGNTTTNTYDAKGNLTKNTDPLGYNTSYAYNASGQVTATTNALGKSAYYTYDSQGNLTQTKDALGNITNMSYDSVGNIAVSTDPKGNTTKFSYDSLNRLIQATFADNSTLTYAYDAMGNRTSATDQLGKTTYFNYDQTGKVTSITNALGYTAYYDYDSEENLISVIDQNNNRTTFEYDALNRQAAQVDAQGNRTWYQYDPVGNRTAVINAKNETITFSYDNLNRLTKTAYPGADVFFTYDSLGRRLTMADTQGTTTYTYDKLGRLIKLDGPQANDTIAYTYDAMGNRLTMVDSDSKTTKYAYDALNRVSSITDPLNKTTTYTYDAAGNQTSITYPNGTKAIYAYDKLNQLIKLTNQKTSGAKLSEYTYIYDAACRKAGVTSLDGSAVSYTYDAAGQLLEEKRTGPAAYSHIYTYDRAGNRIRKCTGIGDYNYQYNSLNQLVQEDARIIRSSGPKTITVSGTVSDKSYIDYVKVNGFMAQLGNDSFTCSNVPLVLGQNKITAVAADIHGNTTTKSINVTYQPEMADIITSYTYDANGNLISKHTAGAATYLGYDPENRLISFNSPDVSEAYTYDGEGKRISLASGGATTKYFYDGMDVILERDASGSTTASYIRSPFAPGGIGGIISATTGAAQNYYYYDAIGTVTALTNSSAAVSAAYSYDAFGNVLSQSGTASNNRNFLTKESATSGLIFFGARYYDPKIGRFISADPSGMSDGPNLYLYCDSVGKPTLPDTNLYVYCLNNPVNLVDLWGLCPEEPGLEAPPWYLDPVDWTVIIVSGGLGSGPKGWLFGRGTGILNSNDLIRIGWGWKGTAQTGKQIFRISVGNKRLPFHWHFP